MAAAEATVDNVYDRSDAVQRLPGAWEPVRCSKAHRLQQLIEKWVLMTPVGEAVRDGAGKGQTAESRSPGPSRQLGYIKILTRPFRKLFQSRLQSSHTTVEDLD